MIGTLKVGTGLAVTPRTDTASSLARRRNDAADPMLRRIIAVSGQHSISIKCQTVNNHAFGQPPLFGMCGKPVRRLEQAHRDHGVCDRTFGLERCGGCLSPAARTHTGRLPERALLRSSRKVTRTGPRDPAAGAPPGSAAAHADTRTVAVSGAGPDAPAPAAQPRTAQVTGRTANTPPDIRAHPPGSCYLYCMISPIRGEFTGFGVQVLGHVKTS